MSSEKEELSQKIVAKFATESSSSVDIDESIPVYGGPTFYYNEYKVGNKINKTEKQIYVDLYTEEIVDLSDVDNSKANANFDSSLKKKDIQASWTDLESRMSEDTLSKSSVVKTSSIGYIYGVPYELARVKGCGPAAGAMVLGYWDTHGYSSFPSGSTLISELAKAMGTTDKWTDIDDIGPGIESVCRKHGYKFSTQDSSFNFNDVADEIDDGNPFVLYLSGKNVIGSGWTNPYNKHFVTCVGYSNSVTDYLFLHDGWDTAHHHYITYRSWDHATAIWVRP